MSSWDTLLRHFREHLHLFTTNSTLCNVTLLFRSSLVNCLGRWSTGRRPDIEYGRQGGEWGSPSCTWHWKSGIGEELLPTTLSKALFLSGPLGGVSAPIPSSENSKARTTSATLTVFVTYRPVALNRRRGHRMMHCRHSPNVSLKISLTGVVDLYTAVYGYSNFSGVYSIPFQKIPYFQRRDYNFTNTIIFFVVQYYYLVFRELWNTCI